MIGTWSTWIIYLNYLQVYYNADLNLCSELTAAAAMSSNSESKNLNKYVYNSKF